MTGQARHRHHRLRQHLRRLLHARAALQGPRGARLRRHQPGRRRGARQGVRRQGADRSTRCSPTPTCDVVINLTIPEAHFGVTSRGARGRQARLFREALRAHRRGGPAAEGARRRARTCASARRPTPSSAARTSCARKLDRRRRGRHRHRRHRHVMRHGMETLAPEPGLLLPARRRAGARRRPLLRRQPHQPDRPGEARRRASTNTATPTRTRHRRGAAQGPGHPGQDADQHPRAARIRQRRQRSPLGASWDVWAHRPPATWSSTAPTARSSCPTRTGSAARWSSSGRDGKIAEVADVGPPVRQCRTTSGPSGAYANYRTAGLADMALAILEGRDARCSLERALHGIDVMTSILKSGETGAFVELADHLHPPRAARPRGGAGAAGLRRTA